MNLSINSHESFPIKRNWQAKTAALQPPSSAERDRSLKLGISGPMAGMARHECSYGGASGFEHCL